MNNECLWGCMSLFIFLLLFFIVKYVSYHERNSSQNFMEKPALRLLKLAHGHVTLSPCPFTKSKIAK